MAKETMSSEERLWAAIRLEKPDRVPVDPLVSLDPLALLTGTVAGRLYTDRNMALQAKLKLYDRYQFDIFEELIPAFIEGHYLSEAIEPKFPGKELPEDYVFQVVEKEVMKRSDYELIAGMGWNKFYFEDYLFRFAPHLRPRDIPKMFETAQDYTSMCVREWEKRGVRMICAPPVFYHPFFRFSLCRSLVRFTEDLYYAPEILEKALDRLTRDTIRDLIDTCKTLNLKVGKIVEERASCFLYPLKIFEQFWWPYTQKIVNALWSEGIVTHFHLDNSWDKNISYFKTLPRGSTILRFDGTTDIFAAKRALRGHACLMGDVHPALLSLGTQEQVEEYCKKLITEVGGDGGFILSSGCCLPPNVKPENLRVMVETCKSHELLRN